MTGETESETEQAEVTEDTETPIIEPTVGRIVHFYDDQGLVHGAMIAYVHNARCVNLTISAHTGETTPGVMIELLQGDDPIPTVPHAQWMPYQKGQAAKTEAVEADLDAITGEVQSEGAASDTVQTARENTGDQEGGAAVDPLKDADGQADPKPLEESDPPPIA